MNYITALSSNIDVVTILLLCVLAFLSTLIVKKFLQVYPISNGKHWMLTPKMIKKWKITNLFLIFICFVLIALKGFSLAVSIKNNMELEGGQANNKPQIVVPAPIVVETPRRLNKEVFEMCLEKASSIDGASVEIVQACTWAALYELQDVK